MQDFSLIVQQGGRKYKVNIRRISENVLFEHFQVFAGEKHVVLRTNYNKRYKKNKVDWQVENGDEFINNVEAFVSIIRQMELHFDELNKKQKPPPPQSGKLFV